jgi:hypothetical protein
MSDLSNDTKKHTTKSRETIPLTLRLVTQLLWCILYRYFFLLSLRETFILITVSAAELPNAGKKLMVIQELWLILSYTVPGIPCQNLRN